MATTYKMIYINARGRGELLRLIFAYKSIEFEDERVAVPDGVAKAREESPYGILPVLHTEGKVLSGNGNIARYLAEKFELAGGNALENAELYGIIDAMEDLWGKMALVFFETDPQKKAELKTKVLSTAVPVTLSKLEAAAQKNGSPEGWIYKNKVSYADFGVFALLDTLGSHAPPELLSKFPALKKIYDNVQKIESISKYLAVRPKTE